MHLLHNHKLKRDVMFLHPGDFYATDDGMLISTVLGSCVSVALWEEESRIGGMNHFMLPGQPKSIFYLDENGRYGMQAMELLINAMMKCGVKKERLKAKVFGGGNILKRVREAKTSISQANIDFAFNYLEVEGIPIISSDVGGDQARKIIFDPLDGKIKLKRIEKVRYKEVESEEKEYLEEIKEKKKGNGFIDFQS